MKQITIGIFHDDTLVKEFGKKATESDMVLFHRKTDDAVFTFIHPVEDKIIPKSQIMNMIDIAIISAENITPALGETILMLDSVNMKTGIIITQPYADNDQLKKMIKDTSLESFEIMSKDVHQIIEFLQNQAIKKDDDAPVLVTIDHFFHVKGVGEVVLGFVNQGTIKKHDKLKLFPQEKDIIIRSIQIQDKDLDQATSGSRVGLAIKGISVEELKRGDLICEPETVETKKTFSLSFKRNPFYPNPTPGKFHATIGLQNTPVTISEINDDTITFETEKPVSYPPHQNCFILDLNAPKLHHIGTATT